MIRFIHCIKRRPELTVEDFRQYWNGSEYTGLVDRLGLALGATRVETNLTLLVEANVELMEERNSKEPFDAVLEVGWDNARRLMELRESPQVAALFKEIEDYSIISSWDPYTTTLGMAKRTGVSGLTAPATH